MRSRDELMQLDLKKLNLNYFEYEFSGCYSHGGVERGEACRDAPKDGDTASRIRWRLCSAPRQGKGLALGAGVGAHAGLLMARSRQSCGGSVAKTGGGVVVRRGY